MEFVAISDTHSYHRDLELPKGDVIIHAGDFCDSRNPMEMFDFLEWYGDLDFEHKILIGGNHDFPVVDNPEAFEGALPADVTWLLDSGTEIDGIKIWGSPFQPDLVGWAFGEKRGPAMKKHWDLIPEDTEILITHTPPAGILDKASSGRSFGCGELLERLNYLNVKVHIFGHVHNGYGAVQVNDVGYINASNFNSRDGLVNAPIEFEY